jgi:hypothetical protein
MSTVHDRTDLPVGLAVASRSGKWRTPTDFGLDCVVAEQGAGTSTLHLRPQNIKLLDLALRLAT